MKLINVFTFLFWTMVIQIPLLAKSGLSYGATLEIEDIFNQQTEAQVQLFCTYKEQNKRANVEIGLDIKRGLKGSLSCASDIGEVRLQANINIENKIISPYIQAYPICRSHNNIVDNSNAFAVATFTNVVLGSSWLVLQKELSRLKESYNEDFYEQECIKGFEKIDQLFKQAERRINHG